MDQLNFTDKTQLSYRSNCFVNVRWQKFSQSLTCGSYSSRPLVWKKGTFKFLSCMYTPTKWDLWLGEKIESWAHSIFGLHVNKLTFVLKVQVTLKAFPRTSSHYHRCDMHSQKHYWVYSQVSENCSYHLVWRKNHGKVFRLNGELVLFRPSWAGTWRGRLITEPWVSGLFPPTRKKHGRCLSQGQKTTMMDNNNKKKDDSLLQFSEAFQAKRKFSQPSRGSEGVVVG